MDNIIKKKYYLNNLSDFLPSLQLLSFHGKGRGGGEVLVDRIIKIYSKSNKNKNLKIISCNENLLLRISEILKNRDGSLFTAGLRDLDIISLSIVLRKKFNIYNQVPYHKAIKFKKDPVHYLLVKFYFFIIKYFANQIFINSLECIPFTTQRVITLLPIMEQKKLINKIEFNKYTKKTLTLGTVFRLTEERGIGSKDYAKMIDFLLKMNKCTSNKNIEFKVIHCGDFNEKLQKKITNKFNKIEFLGFKKNWCSINVDAYFFISKYEGFGLAPYEASFKNLVFVNDAFPKELFESSPNIYPIENIFQII